MAPVMERDEVTTGAMGRLRAVTPSCLTTTLYDLIAALQEVVGPDNDALVVATVEHLLRSGRLTWRAQAGGHRDQARSPTKGSHHYGAPVYARIEGGRTSSQLARAPRLAGGKQERRATL